MNTNGNLFDHKIVSIPNDFFISVFSIENVNTISEIDDQTITILTPTLRILWLPIKMVLNKYFFNTMIVFKLCKSPGIDRIYLKNIKGFSQQVSLYF